MLVFTFHISRGGVAKEVEVIVNTAGIIVDEARVFKTELSVSLGEVGGIILGTMDIMVRVGTAKLRMRKNVEPVHFYCVPGESVTETLLLGNSGNITLRLETRIENMSAGSFTCEKNIEIAPDAEVPVPITFSCSPQSTLSSNLQMLLLSVVPNGPKHLIKLQSNVVSTKESVLQFQSSKPVLSFGTIKKPSALLQQGIDKDMPLVFPVESDRSNVNFFNVVLGTSEEQFLNLRNSTAEIVSLNMIIRETESFYLLVPAGLVSTSQIVLPPLATMEVKILFRPTMIGTIVGKLVLKPQGRKMGGKSIKATINLCGIGGSCNMVMDGVEELEPNRYQLACKEMPIMIRVRFMNKGEATGFVSIVSDQECGNSKVEVVPSKFLLESGMAKDVLISSQDDVHINPFLSVFIGPELVRQVLKRCRELSLSAATVDNPAMLCANLLEEFPGEKVAKMKENFGAQLASVDGKQFYHKTQKHLISLTLPSKAASYDALAVEETLSETRIDQSIAMAVPVSSGKVCRQQGAYMPQSTDVPCSPPTPDSTLVLVPSTFSLTPGEEVIVKLTNKSSHPMHWDLS